MGLGVGWGVGCGRGGVIALTTAYAAGDQNDDKQFQWHIMLLSKPAHNPRYYGI